GACLGGACRARRGRAFETGETAGPKRFCRGSRVVSLGRNPIASYSLYPRTRGRSGLGRFPPSRACGDRPTGIPLSAVFATSNGPPNPRQQPAEQRVAMERVTSYTQFTILEKASHN